mgnify:CR=1 FL=1
MNTIKIDKKKIGLKHKPFIIAEMSGNHNQSLERALKIVDAVAKTGADAIKLQTYTPDTITLDVDKNEFFINDKNSLWEGEKLYDLYKTAHTPWDWHKPIMDRAADLGLICFSSPFDESAVDFLEELNVPAYKVASFENSHIPLIKKIISTGKPIIISTGMATLSELGETVNIIKDHDCKDLILLKCTSNYPADSQNSNIATIPHMREMFNCEVGLSDHTLGNVSSVMSIAYGVKVIEKHYTLKRSDGGPDAEFSMEPEELFELSKDIQDAFMATGDASFERKSVEESNIKFRRSLYIVEDMKKGEVFTDKNLKRIRPGFGIAPKFFKDLLGKSVNQSVERGTPVSWSIVDKNKT